MERKEIAKFIDHTQLSACATESDIKKLCEEAVKYGFASCCVNPVYVPFAAEILRGWGFFANFAENFAKEINDSINQ